MTRGMTMGEVARLLDLYETLPLGNGMSIQKAGEWRLSEAQMREIGYLGEAANHIVNGAPL